MKYKKKKGNQTGTVRSTYHFDSHYHSTRIHIVVYNRVRYRIL